MSNYNERLDDVLMSLSSKQHKQGLAQNIPLSKYEYEAKQAILSDLLEIIGEDEEITITDPDTNDFGKVVGHPYNEYRQELREKVKKYCE